NRGGRRGGSRGSEDRTARSWGERCGGRGHTRVDKRVDQLTGHTGKWCTRGTTRSVEHARKSRQDPAKHWPENILALRCPGRHVGGTGGVCRKPR
ncbi:hypothetical protein ID866_13055, partial [Astraeus odoratus]